jgi:hypothetical protein
LKGANRRGALWSKGTVNLAEWLEQLEQIELGLHLAHVSWIMEAILIVTVI